MREKQLSIDGPMFDDMRDDINDTLAHVLTNIIAKGQDEGKITLNLHVKVESDGKRFFPSYTYDINSVLQTKSKVTGEIPMQYGFQYDKSEGRYVIVSGQMGFDDVEDEDA